MVAAGVGGFLMALLVPDFPGPDETAPTKGFRLFLDHYQEATAIQVLLGIFICFVSFFAIRRRSWAGNLIPTVSILVMSVSLAFVFFMSWQPGWSDSGEKAGIVTQVIVFFVFFVSMLPSFVIGGLTLWLFRRCKFTVFAE